MVIVDSIKSLRKIIEEKNPSKTVLITSDFLIKKLSWAIEELKGIISFEVMTIPDGEDAKEWDVLEKVLEEFIKIGLDRNGLVLDLGGGTVSDLVGFASSIYQRGISYINIPSTILSQVDASIGGKTAINFSGYKNQVGSFCEPLATVIDDRFIKDLSKEQIIDGLAEIIKAGLVKDPNILEIIKTHSIDELKEPSLMRDLIYKSIKVKEYFVKKDPRDVDIRQILNFGHTIGHALELKYGLSHGRAVLIGMSEELKIGERLGLTSLEVKKCLEEITKKLGIVFDELGLEVDLKSIMHDKKISKDKIVLPVVKKIGEAELVEIEVEKLTLTKG